MTVGSADRLRADVDQLCEGGCKWVGNPYTDRLEPAQPYQEIGVKDFMRGLAKANVTLRTDSIVFEHGSDITGKVGLKIQRMTGATYVGMNCDPFHLQHSPYPESLKYGNNATKYVKTDCRSLPFKSGVFSAAMSHNVLEHAGDPLAYVEETHRVLAPGAVAFLEWCPVWNSPQGHHLHPDMVQQWAQGLGCPAGTHTHYVSPYDKKATIPAYAHLQWTRRQMVDFLERHFARAGTPCPRLAKQMADYAYGSVDLNRWTLHQVALALRSLRWARVLEAPAHGEYHKTLRIRSCKAKYLLIK